MTATTTTTTTTTKGQITTITDTTVSGQMTMITKYTEGTASELLKIINKTPRGIFTVTEIGGISANYPIEGQGRLVHEFEIDWVCLTVWIGRTMVEIRLAANDVIRIFKDPR